MDIRELGQLTFEQELEHWWIQTRFRHLEQALARPCTEATLRVLDVGCGTGQNLQLLRQDRALSARIERMVGVEPAWPCERKMPVGFSAVDRIVQSFTSVSPSDSFNLLLAMDVLEHVDDDRGALKNWVGYLEPGAKVFITVPAFQVLWSQHDEVLQHKRRYTIAHLAGVAEAVSLKPIAICYAFSYLFVPLYVVRVLLRRMARAKDTSDLALAPPWINSLLSTIGCLEAQVGGSSICGTSVIGYFEKPDGTDGA